MATVCELNWMDGGNFSSVFGSARKEGQRNFISYGLSATTECTATWGQAANFLTLFMCIHMNDECVKLAVGEGGTAEHFYSFQWLGKHAEKWNENKIKNKCRSRSRSEFQYWRKESRKTICWCWILVGCGFLWPPPSNYHHNHRAGVWEKCFNDVSKFRFP